MLYLNHAGTSWPKPEPVQRAVAQALEESPKTWPASFEAQHRAVASAFGIARPERLLLTPGCTAALHVGITDHPWRNGDRIVTSGWEHHALHRPVIELARRGVDHVIVPPSPDPGAPLDLDRLEAVLGQGRVRLVAMCAAASITGALLPMADAIGLAHAHGALVLIDAAQVAGWLAIDVAGMDIDLLAFAGHKGPQAPWGIGGLYVAPHVTMTSPRAPCEVPEEPGYCDTGSVDRLALAGLAAGLAWLAEPTRVDRLARARAMVQRIADGARQLPGVTLHGPPEPGARMPTLALSAADRTPARLARALRQQGVAVSGGLQCAPLAHQTLGTAPDGVVRLSVGPTTPEDAADQCLAALSAVLG